MINSILKFIGSKWFTLVLMILMGVFIPTTWNNLMVVIDKGQLTAYWWVAAVFVCNALGVLFAFWKFMQQITSKPQVPSTAQSW